MANRKCSNKIIGLTIEVFSTAGSGMPETIYRQSLSYKMEKSGLLIERGSRMALINDKVELEDGCRIDLLAELVAKK